MVGMSATPGGRDRREIVMRNLKRNGAVVGAGAVIAALGLGGVMSAQADTNPTPAPSQTQQIADESPGESSSESDGPDVGPDVNPSEPGHQDADESGDVGESEAAGETESAQDDGPNVGPDANPNEPGHQDADESGDVGGN